MGLLLAMPWVPVAELGLFILGVLGPMSRLPYAGSRLLSALWALAPAVKTIDRAAAIRSFFILRLSKNRYITPFKESLVTTTKPGASNWFQYGGAIRRATEAALLCIG